MAKKQSNKNCKDKNCPFHGTLSLKKTEFKGKVISSKAQKTVTVQWFKKIKMPKYERYMEKISKVKAHNPSCIDLKEGDEVIIASCRPLSKTKKFCVKKKIDKK
jgi:small subunit ribosomal protein S17